MTDNPQYHVRSMEPLTAAALHTHGLITIMQISEAHKFVTAVMVIILQTRHTFFNAPFSCEKTSLTFDHILQYASKS